ncbi:MAG: RHS repeat-associated core domain-containing protein [Chloroflexi bacterium]|nr:MAG: RHS repeat-associated core domain-containing protein [Chloroflexota bacterium]
MLTYLDDTSAIRQGNGTVQQTRYLPFGGYRAGSGPNPITSHAYTSQQENMDIGLYYYNARYYAPTLARFLSADTLVPDPQNPQSLNRYAYVLNSPFNYTDPTGHCVENYAGKDDELLAYCRDSVLELARFWAENYEEDFTEYVQWMMMYADIDLVLDTYTQFGLDPLPDNPVEIRQQQWEGCMPLQGGGLNCPPEGGWPEYIPSEFNEKELGIWLLKKGLGVVVNIGVGKIINNDSLAFIVGRIVNHVITNQAVDAYFIETTNKSLDVMPNHVPGPIGVNLSYMQPPFLILTQSTTPHWDYAAPLWYRWKEYEK